VGCSMAAMSLLCRKSGMSLTLREELRAGPSALWRARELSFGFTPLNWHDSTDFRDVICATLQGIDLISKQYL
jgi:hypothetical protein